MIVIVVGMHRSGTSAIAGLLHNNGIMMGNPDDFFPPPMKENPKGFFENRRFRAVNDQVLSEFKYHVKSFDPAIPNVTKGNISESVWNQMLYLVDQYGSARPHWGWKDPRTCLTIYHWLKAIKKVYGTFNNVKIVSVYREPALIAQSMRNRGNKERILEFGQFELLAKAYRSVAFKYIEMINYMEIIDGGPPLNIINIDFVKALKNIKKMCADLSTYFGMPIGNKGFIDPAISKTVIKKG